MDVETYLPEEYKSLRDEIAKRQDARQIILGFTVTGTGTVLGLTLGNPATAVQGMNYYLLALISFALAMLIAALIMIIHHTQQIDVISSYIRKFIEPNVSGIRWETRWTQYREAHRSNRRAGGLPLGTSKPMAVYCGFMTAAIYSVTFVTGLYQYWPALMIVSALAIASLLCALDLYLRWTRGWKVNWDIIDDRPRQ